VSDERPPAAGPDDPGDPSDPDGPGHGRDRDRGRDGDDAVGRSDDGRDGNGGRHDDAPRPPASDDPGLASRAVDAAVGVVWNRAHRRLRAPWRLLAGVVVLGVTALVVGAVVGAVGAAAGLSLAGIAGGAAFGSAVLAVATATLVVVAAVALDRRRLADYGLGLDRAWARDAAFGGLLGVALVSGIALVGLATGWMRVTGVPVASPDAALAGSTAGTLALFLLVGVYEEVLVRGYLLTNLAEALTPLGDRAAVAVATLASSAVFGVAHAGNPGATAVSTGIVTLAGVVLAAGYLLTDELAIPIGFHVTWNASLGLWGLPVSGLRPAGALVTLSVPGPSVWTGGSFGPEAGALGGLALVAALVATAAYVRRLDGAVRLHPGVVTPDLRWRE
jgi:hypothetical protein